MMAAAEDRARTEAHVFDGRAFCVMSRGEQLTGRLQGSMEDLHYVVTHGISGLGDLVVPDEAKTDLLNAQKLIGQAMGHIRKQISGQHKL